MIIVTGDTHGSIDFSKLNSANFPEGKNLTKNDYVVILGDFGFLWSHELTKEEEWYLDWFEQKPWTTLFIDGNHENFDRLNVLDQIEMFDGIVGKVSNSVYHLKRGYVYTIDGKKIFCFGGGTSIDKQHRIENVSWWKEELPTVAETSFALDQLDKHNWDVDYIFTHTAPLLLIENEIDDDLVFSKSEPDCLTVFLDTIWGKCLYRKWHFGHFHLDKVYCDGRMIATYYKFYKLN